jgi:hypothetical protein
MDRGEPYSSNDVEGAFYEVRQLLRQSGVRFIADRYLGAIPLPARDRMGDETRR